MSSRPFTLSLAPLAIAAAIGLAGCTTGPLPVGLHNAPPPAPASLKVGVLLPLSGPNAGLGRDLQQAVQLALGPDGPQPDIRDTQGTPAGATAATQAALAAGDVMLLGPLTQGETAAAAAVASGTPILAFTSDRQQGRPGVWPLGITPQQQVARLVKALSDVGKTQAAAVLPDNLFGAALADGLTRATTAAGDPQPIIRRYPTGNAAALDAALRDVSAIAIRRPPPPAPDPNNPAPPPDPTLEPIPPAPFDSLLLAEGGPGLRAIAAHLADYEIRSPAVQVIGPATWARDAANLTTLTGAWYAAPDPAARAGFERAYTARYGTPPPAFADIAYDAATLARLAVANPAALTRPTGIEGVDGPLALQADGQVFRGLAVFATSPSGARLVDPAPASIGPGA